jgi:hypothetical protein
MNLQAIIAKIVNITIWAGRQGIQHLGEIQQIEVHMRWGFAHDCKLDTNT